MQNTLVKSKEIKELSNVGLPQPTPYVFNNCESF